MKNRKKRKKQLLNKSKNMKEHKDKLKKQLFYAAQIDYDEHAAMNNYPTPDEIANEAIDNFIKEIIDDLTITMSKTYRLDKPPFWLIEWIKKFKKEDYKNL